MLYELCKQLRDAGFPAKHDNEGMDDISCSRCIAHGAGYAHLPTLEELIEACGERTIYFTKNSHSDGTPDECTAATENPIKRGHGSTPTEAVARLYIALNPPTKAGV